VFDWKDRLLRNRITDLKSLDVLLTKEEETQLESLRDPTLDSTCCSRLGSIVESRCSMAGASRSSSTTRTDQLPGYLAKLDRPAGREATRGPRRSAWCDRASTWVART
jgi:hypothetical protein